MHQVNLNLHNFVTFSVKEAEKNAAKDALTKSKFINSLMIGKFQSE